MKIKVIGVQPLYEESGKPRLGGNVYGIVLDSKQKGLIGYSSEKFYFGNVNLHEIKPDDVCLVDYEMYQYKGEWKGFPKDLIKVAK